MVNRLPAGFRMGVSWGFAAVGLVPGVVVVHLMGARAGPRGCGVSERGGCPVPRHMRHEISLTWGVSV